MKTMTDVFRNQGHARWAGPITTLLTVWVGAQLLFTPGVARAAEAPLIITDDGITWAVQNNLHKDRGITGSAVKVETQEGVVKLSGTVDNLLAQGRAVQIAESIRGVRSVVNEITVRPIERPDEEIRRDVEAALRQDPATSAYDVSVSVTGAVASLNGEVHSYAEKQLVEQMAKGVEGLRNVNNNLTINYLAPRRDPEIAADVKDRLKWDIWLQGDSIQVSVANGGVTLTGTTGSALARSRAVNDSWVNGVTGVDATALKVEPQPETAQRQDAGYTYRTDDQIRDAILAALPLDPRVTPYAKDITVQVEDRAVILGGSVGYPKARKAAEQVAHNTVGVAWVDNQIDIDAFLNLPSDHETEQALRAALAWDPLLDSSAIEVGVVHHVAYLSGNAASDLEKLEAQDIASRTMGVKLVRNLITVVPEVTVSYSDWPDWLSVTYGQNGPKSDGAIRKSIQRALFWSPFVRSGNVHVAVDGGVATLTGDVGTWIAYLEANNDAKNSGAAVVLNRLTVN